MADERFKLDGKCCSNCYYGLEYGDTYIRCVRYPEHTGFNPERFKINPKDEWCGEWKSVKSKDSSNRNISYRDFVCPACGQLNNCSKIISQAIENGMSTIYYCKCGWNHDEIIYYDR